MEYRERGQTERLTRLAGLFPVVVLAGARQTGKSTLLRRLFGESARAFVFDPVTDVGNARADPELFLRLNPPPLILDEVQFAPELLPVIKRLVDADPGRKGAYFLTGSQQFGVLKGVQESLAGRASLIDLHPLSRAELASDPGSGLLPALFADDPPPDAAALLHRLADQGAPRLPSGNLLERIFRGGYPGLIPFEPRDIPTWFDSYLRTYVERDLPSIRDVSRPHDFSRFLRLLAALTAQEVNTAHLGREIGINAKTGRAWLDALVASFVILSLPAYSGNTVKRVSGRPKAHIADSGFACSLLSISTPLAVSRHPAMGHLFESYVVAEVQRQIGALDTPPRLWHWRSAGGAEVDLVLERDGRFVPIEVKLASRPSRRDARGLASFASTYTGLTCGPRIIIHGGGDLALIDDATVAVPVDWV